MMKKMIMTTFAAGLMASVASAEVAVSLDFASAYVYRGDTFLDGASFQPGIEVSGFDLPEKYGSVAVGIWGSADLDGDNSDTFQETDYYASYSLPVEVVDLYVGYTEYSYGAGSADKEFSVGIGYSLADIGLSVDYFQGVGGGIDTQAYLLFGAGYDIEATEELVVSLGATLGYVDPSEGNGEDGLKNYDLSIGASYALSESWSAGLSATYIGQADDAVLVDVNEGGTYDTDFVGMFSLAYEM